MNILFRHRFVPITILLAWLACCQPAQAWDAEGHMVSAQIAYNHLTPIVKAKCDALIAQTVFDASTINSNFVTAACWADDIKSQTSAYSTWHYVDYPISVDGTSTNSFVTPTVNVVWAINNCVIALQDPTTSTSNRAVNLRFLIHFMGDLTQPLHCSTGISANHPGGDGGGNSYSISGSPSNLHSLWDEGTGYLADSVTRPFTLASQAIITNKAADVAATYPYSVSFTSLQNVTNWALESRNLAQTVSYVGITEGSSPSTSYLNTGSSTSKQRMAVAGQSMADLLNILFAPKTNVVVNNLDMGAGSLRDTIANSQPGDIINFTNSLSGASIFLTSGVIVLTNNVTIDGSALTNGIQIVGNGSDRVFSMASNSTCVLTALTITNGYGNNPSYGGGVINYTASSTLTLNRCTLVGNSTSFSGGGLYNTGTTIVNGCTITGNSTGSHGGGGIYNDGIMSISQSTVSGNTSTTTDMACGVVTVFGSLTMTNTIVAGNIAPSGIQLGYGTFTGANNLTNGNPLLAPLSNYGGPTPTMPPYAGSPAIDAGFDAITNFLTTDQRGHLRQSGAHVDIGAVEVDTNSIVTTNTGFPTAGTLRNAIHTVLPGDLVSFDPSLSGATIMLTAAAPILSNSVTIDASSLSNGILINGLGVARPFALSSNVTVTLSGMTLANGVANNPTYGGGVVNTYASSTLTMNRCTVVGCFASLEGGGVYSAGPATLNQCTITGNSSGGNGGGGVYNDGTMFINQCTISSNTSTTTTTGSGVATYFGSLAMTNSIVAGNSASSALQLSYGTFNGAHNLTNGNPMLAPLGNYGGSIPTMPPLPGSPAVNAGINTLPTANGFTTDQRGYPRIADGFVDLGAVEGVYVGTGPGMLTAMSYQTNGIVQFRFTNFTDANFPVVASTNASLTLSNWTLIGFATESPIGSGQFQFTDSQAPVYPQQRFYRVKSP